MVENIFNNDEKIGIRIAGFDNKQIANLLAKVNLFAPRISIQGDSYSTFEDFIPSNYPSWYPTTGPDAITKVEETWWWQTIQALGGVLEVNDSYSGSELCKMRGVGVSFVDRKDKIGNPDVLFLFGGTNDEWRVRDYPAEGYQTYEEMLGEYKYAGWSEEDLKHFRPALAYLLDYYQKQHPKMKIIFILNDMLQHIVESVHTICRKYNVDVIHLYAITKKSDHPTASGAKNINREIIEFIGGMA